MLRSARRLGARFRSALLCTWLFCTRRFRPVPFYARLFHTTRFHRPVLFGASSLSSMRFRPVPFDARLLRTMCFGSAFFYARLLQPSLRLTHSLLVGRLV